MSLKPIDLQAVFARMGDLSKEQALVKEHSALQQSRAARKQIDQEIEEDHRVSKSTEDREVEPIKEDASNNKGTSKHQKRNNNEERSSSIKTKIIVSDPNIGKHIDMSG